MTQAQTNVLSQRQGKNRFEIGILGKKLGMTQIFAEDGTLTPVTVIQAGPCPVVQIKSKSQDGYDAIQIGFEKIKENKPNKGRAGHFKKANIAPHRYTRELRQNAGSLGQYTVGQEIKVDVFQTGDWVDVIGTSIGKGFQGVMKRHNFKGKDAGRGSHEVFRHGGSLGMRFPQHVAKGRKMAGHMGDERVTNVNLKVMDVKADSNIILIRGSVPGSENALVLIRKAFKRAG